ncbi:MAG: GntR family transcriptional regulator [Rhodobacteraceae bacterium]|nr:GntR family transcriptional regulator [Paracoccaceae bacterium]
MSEAFKFERQRAYDLIVERIFGSDFDRTLPLSERGLSELFGIGRMPVREALRRLEQEGVVEVRPARGTFLRNVEEVDLRRIYQVRTALECLVAADAARQVPSREFLQIGTKLEIMLRDLESFSPADIDDAGTEFHERLVEASGNDVAAETIRLFRTRFRLAFHLPRYFSFPTAAKTLRDHRDIFEAVVAGDPDLAASRMKEHLAKGLELRLRLSTTSKAAAPVT